MAEELNSVIQTTNGSVSIPNRSGKVNVFCIKTNSKGYSELCLPSHTHKSMAKPSITPAFSYLNNNGVNLGEWYRWAYPTVPDGSLFAVQVISTKNARPYSDGMVVVRARSTAALYQVKAVLFPAFSVVMGINQEAIDNETYIEDGSYKVPTLTGCVDIIPKEDFSKWGILLNGGLMKRFFNEDEIEELFDIRILKKEEAPLTTKTIVTSSGQEVVVSKIETKRKIVAIKRR